MDVVWVLLGILWGLIFLYLVVAGTAMVFLGRRINDIARHNPYRYLPEWANHPTKPWRVFTEKGWKNDSR